MVGGPDGTTAGSRVALPSGWIRHQLTRSAWHMRQTGSYLSRRRFILANACDFHHTPLTLGAEGTGDTPESVIVSFGPEHAPLVPKQACAGWLLAGGAARAGGRSIGRSPYFRFE